MNFFKIFKNKTPKLSVEEEMYQNNTMGYRDLKDKADYQDNLLVQVQKANEQYKADNDLDKIIKVYEYAFYESDPPCASSQNLKLVDFYLKNDQNDKAWGYLNFLYAGKHAPEEKIRFLQAKLAKKENRHKEAIKMFMLGYLSKSQWNNSFQKDMFLKDIKPSANKLKWDDDKIEYLAHLVENQVKNGNYNESVLANQYDKAVLDFKE